jgi:hypothetical protein
MASALTYIGASVYRCASSARTMSAQAAPSETPEQSKTPRRPATSGEAAIFSLATSLRNCARSFFAPLAWFFQATWVIASRMSSGSTPYFLQYAGSSSENAAGAVMVSSGAVPSPGTLERTSPE